MSSKDRIVKVMDIPFTNCTQTEFLNEKLIPKIEKGEKCFIVTANPEIIMETRRNKAYKKIVQSANYIVPDGVGILLAAKFQKEPLQERIAGFDLMNDMLSIANKKRAKCFFLGATPEVNDRAVENIQRQYPNIQVTGNHHGYFNINDASVLAEVHKENPDFVFVALGFPKQEEWIYKHLQTFSKGIFIGVGGSFDVFAGNVKRAPSIWIKLNLEWLYRLLKQPFRLRRMGPIIKFIWLVVTKKG